MAKWVKVLGDSSWEAGYINLDQAIATAVVPTIANPNLYALVVYTGTDDSGAHSSYVTLDTGVFNSVGEAEDALRLLIQPYDIPS
jgi:hypothetical protein